MRLPMTISSALLGAGLLALTPAIAAPMGAASKNLPQAQAGENSLVVPAQAGRRRPPHRPPAVHRGPRGGHYRGGYYRRNDGAVAAGILGGLFLGGLIASQVQHDQAVSYCAQRYRSYDPYSRTYMGYDGRRHPCP